MSTDGLQKLRQLVELGLNGESGNRVPPVLLLQRILRHASSMPFQRIDQLGLSRCRRLHSIIFHQGFA